MPRRKSTRRGRGEGTVSERPDGTWTGQVTTGYTEDGRQKRKTVYGKSQADALAKLAEVKQRLASGTYSDTKLTVKEYLKQWLEEKERTLKPTTLEQYTSCIDRSIVPIIGSVKLDKLTPLQVQNLVNQIHDVSGAARAAKCRTVLFSAYKQAIRWQLVTRNPVEATDPVKEPHREMTLWEPEQAARFLDVAREHRLYAFFYLSMATGLRRGELLGLRWVDIEGSLLHVKQSLVKVGSKLIFSTPKTRKGFRTVALSPDVLEVLLLHRQRQDAERAVLGDAWAHPELVFASEVGTPLNPDNLKRVRDYLMNKADVPPVRLHDLRHLHASLAIRGGMDAKVLADRLGHSRASFTLDRYTHLFESQRAQSAVSLLDFLPRSDPDTVN